MSESRTLGKTVEVEIRNIGGISRSNITLEPGVTILSGRNATNRTSFLRALMAGLGSEDVSLKGDADEGYVELTVGESTYRRTFRRQNGTVITEGEGYLDDPTLANLFAFLLESNEARRAVTRGDDLRDLIMRPVDTAEIESEISSLQNRRSSIEAEIEDIEDEQQRLPGLEERQSDLESALDSRREELSDLETSIEQKDGELGAEIDRKDELEDHLAELQRARSNLQSIRDRIEEENQSLEALREERSTVESDLERLDDISEDRLDHLDAELSRVRSRRSDLDDTITRLQSVLRFNEELIEGEFDPFADLDGSDGDGSVTDALLSDTDERICWTCGTDVTTDQLESMVDRFRELLNQYMDERSQVDETIEELKSERDTLEDEQARREKLRSRLSSIESELDRRENHQSDLKARREEALEEVEELEAGVDDLRSEGDQSELVDLHKEANELEVEIDRLESELNDVRSEIDRIESRLDEREDLVEQRREVTDRIDTLRTRIDRLEQEAVTQFNDHMSTVLELLEYRNLERIWLERVEDGQTGRTNTDHRRLELHVVRNNEDGAVYEDTLDHLSESEREVTGLVFALAGYLAHEVYEELPFILLDSVESIDPSRLSALIEYLRDHPDYLVLALLEDDAQQLDGDYRFITEI